MLRELAPRRPPGASRFAERQRLQVLRSPCPAGAVGPRVDSAPRRRVGLPRRRRPSGVPEPPIPCRISARSTVCRWPNGLWHSCL